MAIFLPRKVALVMTLLAWPALAHANIGDDLTTLRHRYGSAKDMNGQMLFEVRLRDGQLIPARDSANPEQHFTITVYFDGDRAGMEVITRNTTDPTKSDLSQDVIQQLLDATSDGVTWVPFQAGDGKPTWLRPESKDNPQLLLARFEASKGTAADDAPVLVIMLYTKK